MNPQLHDLIDTVATMLVTLSAVLAFLYRRLDGMITDRVKAQLTVAMEAITKSNSKQLENAIAEVKDMIKESGEERREDIGRLTDRLDRVLLNGNNGYGGGK